MCCGGEGLHDLGTFAFVALYLFSTGSIHSSTVANLLGLIEMLEEFHTEVQGMISSPLISTTLLYNVLWRWSQYLNIFVAASTSDVVDAPGASVSFSLKPIHKSSPHSVLHTHVLLHMVMVPTHEQNNSDTT